MGRRIAFLIANQDFQPDSGVGALRGPLNDIAALSNLLRDPTYGNFEVKTLVNATSFDIKVCIDEALSDSGRGDLILIHYAGHGRLDRLGNLCLATRDTRARVLQATSIPARHLKDLAIQSDCDSVVLILDCCYSGAAIAENRGDIGSLLTSLEDERGFYILSASSEIQSVSEEDTGTGVVFGLFTAALLGGIKTGAADSDQDGRISLHDLYRYLRGKVPGQTPRILARAGGDPLISLNPNLRAQAAKSGLRLTTMTTNDDDAQKISSTETLDRTFKLRVYKKLFHPAQVLDIAFNHDVTKMATICDDGKVRIYSIPGFEQIGLLRADPGTLRSVSWSRAGHQIATGDSSGFIRWWRDGAEIARRSTGGASATYVKHSSDGLNLAAGAADGNLTMWHARRREPRWTQQIHCGAINTINFNEQGDRVVTASEDGTACVIDVRTGRELSRFEGHGSAVAAAFFILGEPGLSSCVSAGLDGNVFFWSEAPHNEVVFTTKHDFWVRGLCYCQESQTILSGGYDSRIKVIDLRTGAVFEARKVHPEALSCIRTSPCGSYVGVSTIDGQVHILKMTWT